MEPSTEKEKNVIDMELESTEKASSPPSRPKATFHQMCKDLKKKLILGATVLKEIWWKILLLVLYSAFICLTDDRYFELHFKPTIVPIMSTVIGFLLVFRTNTAYDRYYEGRKVWSSMTQIARRLVTCVWIAVPDHSPELEQEKRAIIDCIVAYPVAVKHYLREEYSYDYDDLRALIADLKPFRAKYTHTSQTRKPKCKLTGDSGKKNIRRATRHFSSIFENEAKHGNIPVELVHCIAAYIQSLLDRKLCDVSNVGTMNLLLTRLLDELGSLERILRTPLPLAYSVHLTQAVYIHLIILPVQLVETMDWWTCVAVGFTSFTLLGLLQISAEIENPFGYDRNDLPLDHYCEVLVKEVERVMRKGLRTYEDLFDPPKTTEPEPENEKTKAREPEPQNEKTMAEKFQAVEEGDEQPDQSQSTENSGCVRFRL